MGTQATMTEDEFEAGRIAELREILTAPDEAPRANGVQRMAALGLSGAMTVCIPPLGGTMIAINSVCGSNNLRLSAQLCALGGLAFSLHSFGLIPGL